MEATVYVDLYFLVNFSMDFLCLFLTAKLLNLKRSPLRMALGASFGGIYAVAALFISASRGVSLALDIAACIALCAIAFSRRGSPRLPLYALVYAAISMVLGGFMTALFNLFNKIPALDALKGGDGDGISVWLFALLALISGIVTLIGGRFFSSQMARKRVRIHMVYNGRQAVLEGFTDNGNMLRDPICAKPCIIVDSSAMRSLLPREITDAADPMELIDLERLGDEHKRRVLLIPAHTATGDGMLIGIKMDGISIEDGGKIYGVDAVVALSKLKNNADGAEALIPACLLL